MAGAPESRFTARAEYELIRAMNHRAVPPLRHPALVILILSFAGVVGLGICRFAYALVLPDMRASLGWNYAEAGFMNTVNAVGYLIGALGAASVIRRYGTFAAVWWGTFVCVVTLFASAASGNFVLLSLARTLAGIGAAAAFIGGGTLAVIIAQAYPARSALLIGLFYTGPGSGIMISGLVAPMLLRTFGDGSWWIVWVALAGLAVFSLVLLPVARVDIPPPAGASPETRIPLVPILPILIGYLLFGAGYIAYLTFMIAWVRDVGGDALAQSLFWCLIGAGAFTSPWTWSRLLARTKSGRATAALIAVTLIGVVLPLASSSPPMLALSALAFGNAFLGVVTSTTAYIRHNYASDAWPNAIAIMTISFSIGQTLGPVLTGAITDATGSLLSALVTSAAFLALGAAITSAQAALVRPEKDFAAKV